jgi:hypothetical protein
MPTKKPRRPGGASSAEYVGAVVYKLGSGEEGGEEVVLRTNGEKTPTSPAGDKAGGDEHADVLRGAEEGASDEAEDGAVDYAGFAAPGVHDVGGG